MWFLTFTNFIGLLPIIINIGRNVEHGLSIKHSYDNWKKVL